MLFRQLKYFITVVRCQSFTEAAEECFISQSAISQQIKALEQELGVDLLKREGRHFSLTSAGSYLYDHGQSLLDEVEELKKETIRRGLDNDTELRIGFPKNFSTPELSTSIAEFSKLYPEVNISIISGTHEELFALLLDHRIDMKISEQRRAYDPDYENVELTHSRSYIEISARHPLAGQAVIDTEDLNKLTCILVVSKGQEESERNFYEQTLRLSHRFAYAYSLEEARLMVLSHRGYFPIDVLGQMPETVPGVKRIPLSRHQKPISRNYFACWEKKQSTYYIEEFTALLKKVIQQSDE